VPQEKRDANTTSPLKGGPHMEAGERASHQRLFGKGARVENPGISTAPARSTPAQADQAAFDRRPLAKTHGQDINLPSRRGPRRRSMVSAANRRVSR